MKIRDCVKRFALIALLLTTAISLTVPIRTYAKASEPKVVRVGWYESTYCYRDKYGERRGIAYEYQRRIAAYTGWTYEYVEDTITSACRMSTFSL